jgi:protein gp37
MEVTAMQETAISWTNVTWNPTSGCSKISDGCKHCYAETIALKFGHSAKPWTVPNEEENVLMKPHKLLEPYKLKEPTRIFTNSMSDLFHRAIPDWYRAVVFCVMLDLQQHTFQVLTKRAEGTVDWHEKFQQAVNSDEFKAFRQQVKDKRVRAALEKSYPSAWGANIWMGTSVEDARVTHRIETLRKSQAQVRFISAEPLIGAWGQVNLDGIHWVIVGGESGQHMTEGNPRWMQMEWAREIKNQCVDQQVAFFYKQDSGHRTELRTYLVEPDGSKWVWQQYPGDLRPPYIVDSLDPATATGEPLAIAHKWEQLAYGYLANQPLWPWWSDSAAITAAYWYEVKADVILQPDHFFAPEGDHDDLIDALYTIRDPYEWFTIGDRAVRKSDGLEFEVTEIEGDLISGQRWYAVELPSRAAKGSDMAFNFKKSARVEGFERIHRKHFRRPDGEWGAPIPEEPPQPKLTGLTVVHSNPTFRARMITLMSPTPEEREEFGILNEGQYVRHKVSLRIGQIEQVGGGSYRIAIEGESRLFGWAHENVEPCEQPTHDNMSTTITHVTEKIMSETVPTQVNQATDASPQTRIVDFRDVKEHWDVKIAKWDSDQFVYIGRVNPTYNLPESPWHNPFKLEKDTPENRAKGVEQYRQYITERLAKEPELLQKLHELKGKTLACWCSPKICHGDVLIEFLTGQPKQERKEPEAPAQLSMFDTPSKHNPSIHY